MLNKKQIEALLPHRDPFLLLDKVLKLEKDHILSQKTISADCWFFNGHFPGHPIMPGVLTIEALAQSAAVFAMHNLAKEYHGRPVFFTSIERAKFKKPVYPNCKLLLEAKLARKSGMLWKFDCIAKVEKEHCTEAAIMATIAQN